MGRLPFTLEENVSIIYVVFLEQVVNLNLPTD